MEFIKISLEYSHPTQIRIFNNKFQCLEAVVHKSHHNLKTESLETNSLITNVNILGLLAIQML